MLHSYLALYKLALLLVGRGVVGSIYLLPWGLAGPLEPGDCTLRRRGVSTRTHKVTTIALSPLRCAAGDAGFVRYLGEANGLNKLKITQNLMLRKPKKVSKMSNFRFASFLMRQISTTLVYHCTSSCLLYRTCNITQSG